MFKLFFLIPVECIQLLSKHLCRFLSFSLKTKVLANNASKLISLVLVIGVNPKISGYLEISQHNRPISNWKQSAIDFLIRFFCFLAILAIGIVYVWRHHFFCYVYHFFCYIHHFFCCIHYLFC